MISRYDVLSRKEVYCNGCLGENGDNETLVEFRLCKKDGNYAVRIGCHYLNLNGMKCRKGIREGMPLGECKHHLDSFNLKEDFFPNINIGNLKPEN